MRKFISIYFSEGIPNRKKNDLTIAFNENDRLYYKCKDIGSTKIKEILHINTYNELKLKAENENRSISNYIKSRLTRKLLKNE